VSEPGQSPSFSERLDGLFRRVRNPATGTEYSYEQVAEGVRHKGFDISAAYVWQLRKGQRDNPTLRHILGLAQFFDVTPSYFVDDEVHRRIDAQLDLLIKMRDSGVQDVAERAYGLSESSLSAVSDMIDHVRRLEEANRNRRRGGPAP
jgi:transcriptional regulator with XRE-family HTH domain